MAAPRLLSLNKELRTNASSPNFVKTTDSYLYGRGVRQTSNKVKFFIELVDESGQIVPYALGTNPNNAVTLATPTTNSADVIQGLVLIVNPASVSVNLSKIVGRTQSMVSWIEEHWGEELDTITFTGSTAGFVYKTALPGSSAGFDPQTPMTPEQQQQYISTHSDLPDLASSDPRTPGTYTGLAAKARRETVSYQQWKTLISIMNGNGALFDNWGFVTKRLYVQLSYDWAMYRGYFESIDTTEDSANPFRFMYTITYKSEKTVYSYIK
jgi:hypothetical protein